MKGIIIKDMEMPEACAWYDRNDNYRVCPLLGFDGCCAITSERVDEIYPLGSKPDSCPCRAFCVPFE